MSMADPRPVSIAKSKVTASKRSLAQIVLAVSLVSTAGVAAIGSTGLTAWILLDLLGY